MARKYISKIKKQLIIRESRFNEYIEIAIKHNISLPDLYRILKSNEDPISESTQLESLRKRLKIIEESEFVSEIEKIKILKDIKNQHESITSICIERNIKSLCLDLYFLSNTKVSQKESILIFQKQRNITEEFLISNMNEYGSITDPPKQETYQFNQDGSRVEIDRVDWFLRDYAKTLFNETFFSEIIRASFSNAFVHILYANILHLKNLSGAITDNLIFDCNGYSLALNDQEELKEIITNNNNNLRKDKISETKSITGVIQKEKYDRLLEIISNEIRNLGKYETKEITSDYLTKTEKSNAIRKDRHDEKTRNAKMIAEKVHGIVRNQGITTIKKEKFTLSTLEDLQKFIASLIKNNKEIKEIYNTTRFPE